MTQRARLLLAELLREPGLSAMLRTVGDDGVKLQLTMQMPKATKVELQALFDSNGQPITDGIKRRHEEIEDKAVDEAEVLLNMYKQHSGRQLYKLRPDVWTSHGHSAMAYKHLDGKYDKPKKGPGGSNGRVTNRPFVSFFNLNGIDIEAGLTDHPPPSDYKHIIISFTRASSAPPTYGAQGMFDRGATAARAWSIIEPKIAPLIVSLPRARVASKWPLNESRALVGEIMSVLNAAAGGMVIELLSVGIDGLITDVLSLQWLFDTWDRRLHLRLVMVVPSSFPGTPVSFPVHSDNIRYGVIDLDDVSEVLAGPTLSQLSGCGELVVLLRKIRDDKDDRDDGYLSLNKLTFGRSNFRVCPNSLHESGVGESERQSHSLR